MRREERLSPDPVDVFGDGPLRLASAEHTVVVRQAAAPGERARYRKSFLATPGGDFRPWTAREWQVLQQLAAGPGRACVAQVAAYEGAHGDQPAVLTTFDAGVSVHRWSLLQPEARAARGALRHVFEDCAHWWALARHSLAALDTLHAQGVVHLALEAGSLCVPALRPDAQADAGGPRVLAFDALAIIGWAFARSDVVALDQPLPLAHELRYDHQSPRLLDALDAGRQGDLRPTRALDWRCDFFSLAALLWLYLPEPDAASDAGWTPERHTQASLFVRRLLDEHNADLSAGHPHAELTLLASTVLEAPDLQASLRAGWHFRQRAALSAPDWAMPVTRLVASREEAAADPARGVARATVPPPVGDAPISAELPRNARVAGPTSPVADLPSHASDAPLAPAATLPRRAPADGSRTEPALTPSDPRVAGSAAAPPRQAHAEPSLPADIEPVLRLDAMPTGLPPSSDTGVEPVSMTGVEPVLRPGAEPTTGPAIEAARPPRIEPATAAGIAPARPAGIEPPLTPSNEPALGLGDEATPRQAPEATSRAGIEPTLTPSIEPALRPGDEATPRPALVAARGAGVEPALTPSIEPVLRSGDEATPRPASEATSRAGIEPTLTPSIEPVSRPGDEATPRPVLAAARGAGIEPALTPSIEPVLRAGDEPAARSDVELTGGVAIAPALTPSAETVLSPGDEQTPGPDATGRSARRMASAAAADERRGRALDAPRTRRTAAGRAPDTKPGDTLPPRSSAGRRSGLRPLHVAGLATLLMGVLGVVLFASRSGEAPESPGSRRAAGEVIAEAPRDSSAGAPVATAPVATAPAATAALPTQAPAASASASANSRDGVAAGTATPTTGRSAAEPLGSSAPAGVASAAASIRSEASGASSGRPGVITGRAADDGLDAAAAAEVFGWGGASLGATPPPAGRREAASPLPAGAGPAPSRPQAAASAEAASAGAAGRTPVDPATARAPLSDPVTRAPLDDPAARGPLSDPSASAASAASGAGAGASSASLRDMAAWAEPRLARVLALADLSRGLPREETVRSALGTLRVAAERPRTAYKVRARDARRLNEAARRAYWNDDDPARALALQRQAFDAHPIDPEIAGNLAFYRMRQATPQVQAARDLVLHSLALPDRRFPGGRVEDWTTLAITNALLGREDDARRAWVVALAVADDPQRQRSAALKARSIYGERLGPSVEAMLRQVGDESPTRTSRGAATILEPVSGR